MIVISSVDKSSLDIVSCLHVEKYKTFQIWWLLIISVNTHRVYTLEYRYIARQGNNYLFGPIPLINISYLPQTPLARAYSGLDGNTHQGRNLERLALDAPIWICGFKNFYASVMTPQLVEQRLIYVTRAWKEVFRYHKSC